MISFRFKDVNGVKLSIGKEGKSLRAFSRQIGVSQPYLSRVLNEKNNPSATVAKKIAQGLNTEIENVFFITIDNKNNQKEGQK